MGYLCGDWEFTEKCSELFLQGKKVDDVITVDLPHTVKELPLQYADEREYQMISGYRKLLTINREPGMRYILHFEGAAHIAEVFASGTKIAEHRCGYTAFDADITDHIGEDGQCLVAVRLDSTENPSIPPFGFVVDYLTFGGIYRPVELLEVPEISIRDVFVSTPDTAAVYTEVYITGTGERLRDCSCSVDILDAEGNPVVSDIPALFDDDPGLSQEHVSKLTPMLPDPVSPGFRVIRMSCEAHVENTKLWSCETPYLYTLRARLFVKPREREEHEFTAHCLSCGHCRPPAHCLCLPASYRLPVRECS